MSLINNNNSITKTFTDHLIKISKKNKKIIVLDADLADDLDLYKFRDNFPNRFIQNGIAEQDMVSMAGGISRSGLIPIVNSFAAFLTSRANEQIYNNATEKTKIIYLSLYAGLLPAGAGKSHQSIRDIGLIGSIPNFKIYHPANFFEVKGVLDHCVKNEKKNCLIRINIGPAPKSLINRRIKFREGVGTVLKNGNSAIVFSYGQFIIDQVLKAAEILSKSNISIKVVNISSLNSFKLNWYKKTCKDFKKIFCIEDHYKTGGLSDNLLSFLVHSEILKDKGFYSRSIKDFPECGTVAEVLKFHKLDFKSIAKFLKSKIDK